MSDQHWLTDPMMKMMIRAVMMMKKEQ